MKKLELKNLKVKKMSTAELTNVKGGLMMALDASDAACHTTWVAGPSCGDTKDASQWPLSCGQSVNWGC